MNHVRVELHLYSIGCRHHIDPSPKIMLFLRVSIGNVMMSFKIVLEMHV